MSKDTQPQPYPVPGYPPYPYLPAPEQDEINLLDLWRVLMDYKWSIIAITILGAMLSVAVALWMEPVFRAETLLAPAADDSKGARAGLTQLGGLASMMGINIGGNVNNTDQLLATLNSRAFLDDFIRDEKLLPTLFAKRWDAEANTWKLVGDEKPPTALDGYTVLAKRLLSISADKKSGLVTLAVEWGDPQQASDWANKLVQRFNEYQRQEAIAQSNRNIQYLQQQIQQTSVLEVQKMFYSLIESELKSKMMANVRQQYAFKVIDPAQPPEKKIKPKRALIVVLGTTAGMMIAVFLAFFRNFIRNQRAQDVLGQERNDKE